MAKQVKYSLEISNSQMDHGLMHLVRSVFLGKGSSDGVLDPPQACPPACCLGSVGCKHRKLALNGLTEMNLEEQKGQH